MEDCDHKWVYSPNALLSCPPKYKRICRKCGKREIVMGTDINPNEYDDVVKYFEKKEEV